MDDWFTLAASGALIALRVIPNAGRDRIEGVVALADGTRALRVRVAAPPDKGRANQAVIALLAKAAGLPKSAFFVKSGASARSKLIALEADPVSARAALERIAQAATGTGN